MIVLFIIILFAFLLTLISLKMQSQLEAALLGHSTNLNHDDDENNYQEEETEDNEEFDEVSFVFN